MVKILVDLPIDDLQAVASVANQHAVSVSVEVARIVRASLEMRAVARPALNTVRTEGE